MSVTLFHINITLILVLLGLIVFIVLCVGGLTIVLLFLYSRLRHYRTYVQKTLAHQQFPDYPCGPTLRDQWYHYLQHIHHKWDALRLVPKQYTQMKGTQNVPDSTQV